MAFHEIHCLYSFKKLYRAMLGLTLSDSYILRSGHITHCQHFIVAEYTSAVICKLLYSGLWSVVKLSESFRGRQVSRLRGAMMNLPCLFHLRGSLSSRCESFTNSIDPTLQTNARVF